MALRNNEPLVTRRVRLDDLHADVGNVNTHPELNIRTIRDSLKQFGQVEPLIVQKGTGKVIGGNGRLQVMRDMGLAECDVVEIDASNVEATALGLALNRTAKTSTFDDVALAETLRALQSEDYPIEAAGWTDDEVNGLLERIGKETAGPVDAEPPDDFAEYDEDIETEHECPKCGYRWSGEGKLSHDALVDPEESESEQG